MLNAIRTISVGRLLLALAVSIFLWTYIQLNVIQETTATYNEIPLKIIYPPEQSFVVLHSSQIPRTISVNVSGTSDAVHSLIPTNIIATLDLSSYQRDFNGSVKINVTLTDKVDGVNNLIPAPADVAVQIEQRVTKTLPLQVLSSGTPPSYISIGQIQSDTSDVTVTGPQSEVSQIVSATVPVNVSNYSSTTTFSDNVVLLDKNGHELVSDDVVPSPKSVKLTVPVQSEFDSKTVPIEVTTKGQPFAGYTVSSIDYSPRIVTIYGPPGTLINVQAVQTTPVDITGASTPLTATATLQLPGGVTTPSTENIALQVTINFMPLESQKLVFVPLEVQNLPTGYSVEPAYLPITVTLAAPANILQEVNPGDIHASVDLAGKTSGHYDNLPIVLQIPSIGIKTSAASPSSVSLTLIPPATATPRPLPTATPVPLPTYTPTPIYIPPTATPTASPTTPPHTTTTTQTPVAKVETTPSPVPPSPAGVVPSSSAIERVPPTTISGGSLTPAATPPSSTLPTATSSNVTPEILGTTPTAANSAPILVTVQITTPAVPSTTPSQLPVTPPKTLLFQTSHQFPTF